MLPRRQPVLLVRFALLTTATLGLGLLALLFIRPAQARCNEAPLMQTCGDGVCEGHERSDTCPQDCLVGPYCGDSACEGTERSDTCPQDCLMVFDCGDGVCAGGAGEDASSCPDDCFPLSTFLCLSSCGNGMCDPQCGEDVFSCGQDCPVQVAPVDYCGDGFCSTAASETCSWCPQDCGECPSEIPQQDQPGVDGSLCGDGICQAGESADWCGDCVAPAPPPQSQGQPPAQNAPQSAGSASGGTQSEPSPTPTLTPTPTSTPTPTATPTETDEDQGLEISTLIITPEPRNARVGIRCPIVIGLLFMFTVVVGPLGAVARSLGRRGNDRA